MTDKRDKALGQLINKRLKGTEYAPRSLEANGRGIEFNVPVHDLIFRSARLFLEKTYRVRELNPLKILESRRLRRGFDVLASTVTVTDDGWQYQRDGSDVSHCRGYAAPGDREAVNGVLHLIGILDIQWEELSWSEYEKRTGNASPLRFDGKYETDRRLIPGKAVLSFGVSQEDAYLVGAFVSAVKNMRDICFMGHSGR